MTYPLESLKPSFLVANSILPTAPVGASPLAEKISSTTEKTPLELKSFQPISDSAIVNSTEELSLDYIQKTLAKYEELLPDSITLSGRIGEIPVQVNVFDIQKIPVFEGEINNRSAISDVVREILSLPDDAALPSKIYLPIEMLWPRAPLGFYKDGYSLVNLPQLIVQNRHDKGKIAHWVKLVGVNELFHASFKNQLTAKGNEAFRINPDNKLKNYAFTTFQPSQHTEHFEIKHHLSAEQFLSTVSTYNVDETATSTLLGISRGRFHSKKTPNVSSFVEVNYVNFLLREFIESNKGRFGITYKQFQKALKSTFFFNMEEIFIKHLGIQGLNDLDTYIKQNLNARAEDIIQHLRDNNYLKLH